MTRHARFSIFLGLAGASLALASCMSHTRGEPTLEVDASIASVTLGDDCGSERAPGLIAPGDCAPGTECPSFCTQTGVRLSLEAQDADVTEAVPFEVLRLRMYTMDGEQVEELSGRNPRVFLESGYEGWDEMIESGDSLHVTYDLNAPDWARIGDGDAWSTYGMSFRIEVDVRIDGVEQTLEFSPASREPEVVT